MQLSIQGGVHIWDTSASQFSVFQLFNFSDMFSKKAEQKTLNWIKYLVSGVGRRTSMLGERLGADWLTYNPFIMLTFHQQGLSNAPKLAATMAKTFPEAETFLDVGCGTGTLPAHLAKLGLRAAGCERSFVGRAIAKLQGTTCYYFDLTASPPTAIQERFDVVSCFEVAEHLPRPLGDELIRFLTSFDTTVVWSAAQPGQGGTGHINEQPIANWIQRYEQHSFKHDVERSRKMSNDLKALGAADWIWQNICIFSPSGR